MSKIKILQFPISNARGGITSYVLNNWKYIDKDKFQFDFVTMGEKLDFEDELRDQGGEVFYISCYAEMNRQQFIKEMSDVLDRGYDVVHLHTSYWKSFIVEEIAQMKKIPKIIVHSHNIMIDVSDDYKRQKALELHNLRKSQLTDKIATDFWACSRLAAEWLYGNQIPQSKIMIMNNAIDVSRFQYDEKVRMKYKKEYNLEGKFVIGHIGRFVYQKNHNFLIDVFSEIHRKRENAVLILVGKGPLENSIKAKINERGLQDRVIFLGVTEAVDQWLQVMDVFVLPSRFEGLPIVLVEAQCAGLKCIASDTITDEIRITDNLIRLPFEKEQWVDKILKYESGYNRKDMRQKIKEKGFDIEMQIKKIEKLYSC